MSSNSEPDGWSGGDSLGIEGIEFIEFATFDDDEFDTLVTTFESLGFVISARHRSKDVFLFRQGDINLILNRELDSYARSYAISHGMSVCAMAFRVPDARTARTLALQRGASEYTEKIGPGELRIPAVRGILGILFFFVDLHSSRGSIYETDFKRLTDIAEEIEGAGLLRIDHVSQTVLQERTREWVEYYAKLFGFEQTEYNRITDPGGSVLSTVMSNPERNVHFCINEPLDPDTDSGQFLKAFFGEGVQHVAFATDDIFATLETMEKRGLGLLPIPDVYYRELEEEGELDAVLIERLRRFNVMYDCEGGGRFLHAWTRPVRNNAFFFEIVQRDNHTGFGRSNARVRLMALQELRREETE